MPAADGPAHTPWPPDAAARYRATGHWRGQSFGTWLSALALAHADRTAVVGYRAGADPEPARWTYRELDERAYRLAAGLVELGLRAGDRVVLQLPNVPDFLAVVFALFRLGAWPVFALPAHRDNELRHFAGQTEAAAIITVDRHDRHDYAAMAGRVAAAVPSVRHVLVLGEAPAGAVPLDQVDAAARVLADLDPAGVAFLQLSGGSTGLPKLIPRTHDDYLYSVRESARICALRPESVYLAALPVSHNYPLSSPGVLGALHAGATTVLAPSPDADTAFGLIERERVTITGVVPPLAAAWVQAAARTERDLSSLAVLQVGGAKCGRELAARIGPALGCAVQQVFGMAEGLVNYTRLDDPAELVLASQGRPISADDEIRVVDPADPAAPSSAEVADGEVGALLTRGPYTIRGYYRAAEHNAVAFTPDGFYRTGDLVRRLPSGYLEVVGRVKDQINRGGEKIAAEEVENHLMAHPGVLDAAVVALPDDYLGERSCAYVIPAAGQAPTPSDLRRFVRDRGVAAFKVPDRVLVVDEFPVTGVGKTSKRELRAAIVSAASERAASERAASERAAGERAASERAAGERAAGERAAGVAARAADASARAAEQPATAGPSHDSERHAMSLPRIDAYPLPGAGDIPRGRVAWRPEPDRAALLVHDMQRYFLAPFEPAALRGLLGNIASVLRECRARSIPVFYTAQPGRQSARERGLLTEFWGDGIGAVIDADPRAEAIVDELAPQPGDVRLTKWRYSAFQRSSFAEQLAERGRDQLLITGVYAHIGCQATAVEAFMRDVRPFLVADGVADFSRRHHDQAVEYVAQRCGVAISTADVLASVRAGGPLAQAAG